MGQKGQNKVATIKKSKIDKGPSADHFVSIYRVSLVKDESIQMDQVTVSNSEQAQYILRNFIRSKGQTDREQFCVALINSRNEIIGLNMVSTGDLTRTIASPREILKTGVLASASGIILGHNHPSSDLSPSIEDNAITKRMVFAGKILGIRVHDHLIVSMEDERYYSFADQGLIQQFGDEADRIERVL